MAARIVSILEEYRLSKLKCSQKLLEQISRSSNISDVRSTGLLSIIKPLLQDDSTPIKNNAILIVSTCIQIDKSVIADVLETGLFDILSAEMNLANTNFKKSYLCILKAIINQNVNTCKKVLKSPIYDILTMCLYDHDSEVREYAGLALASAARSEAVIATDIVDRGFGPHLITMLQESKLSLKRSATAAIMELMRQSDDIANTFAVNPVLELLKQNLTYADKTLISRTLDAFSAIAKHSDVLAEKILLLKAFPKCLEFFESRYSPNVNLSAAVLVREMVKHNSELARAILYFGGVGALVEALRLETPTSDLEEQPENWDDEAVNNIGAFAEIPLPQNVEVTSPNSEAKSKKTKSPCPESDKKLKEKYISALITSLGYISGHGNELAACVIKSGGVQTLLALLRVTPVNSNVVETGVWTLGQILRNAPANVDQNEIIRYLIHLLMSKQLACDVQERCQTTLRNCIAVCQDLFLLENLLLNSAMYELTEDLLADVLVQLELIMSSKPNARRQFVSVGSLRLIRSMSPEPGTRLFEACRQLTECFPEEIVAYFTPGYEEMLMERLLSSDINMAALHHTSRESVVGQEQQDPASLERLGDNINNN